jgi:ATP-dependent Clp protease protease subunit
MAELRLTGVVSWYDIGYEDETFNPERVKASLANIKPGEDLEIYMDSPGGDIDAGGKIVAAIRHWMARNPEASVTITIGQYALSMAAVVLAMLPSKVRVLVNPDTLVMYHSCSGICFGSPDEIRAQADFMSAWNDNVKAAILLKTTLEADQVEAWFDAGHEGWLSSAEAIKYGLADGYATQEFAPYKGLPEDAQLEGRIAALYAYAHDIVRNGQAHKYNQEADIMTIEELVEKLEALQAEVEELKAKLPVEEPETEPETEPTEPTAQGDDGAQDDEGTETEPEEDKDGELDGEPGVEPTDGEPEGDPDEGGDEDEDPDKLLIQALEARVAELEAANSKLTKAFRTPQKGTAPAPATWEEVSASLPKGAGYEDAYLAAKKEHKALFADYMRRHSQRTAR